MSGGYVTVGRDVAEIVRRVFLPANPNKLRSASPLTVAAAKAFIGAVESPTDNTHESLIAALRAMVVEAPSGDEFALLVRMSSGQDSENTRALIAQAQRLKEATASARALLAAAGVTR